MDIKRIPILFFLFAFFISKAQTPYVFSSYPAARVADENYYSSVWWRFENNGDDERDNLDLTNNGAYYSGTYYVEGSYRGSANGSNYRFEGASYEYKGTNNSFMITGWIRKQTDISGGRSLFSTLWSDDGFQIRLNAYSTPRIDVVTGNGVSTQTAYSNGLTFNTATWYFIAVAFTPSSVTIYFDGTDETSFGMVESGYDTNNPVYIGCDTDLGEDSYSEFDDWRLYKRILSSTEITYLKNNPGDQLPEQ